MNTENIPTPRTDAQYKEYAHRDNNVKCVDIEFARQLEQELEQAKEELARIKSFTWCAYCGAEFHLEAPATQFLIGEHIAKCEKHPMRRIEKQLEQLQAENIKLKKSFDQSQEARQTWLKEFDRLTLESKQEKP